MSQTRQQPPSLRLRKNYLPDDVVLDILSRLPVKSILRFRCVSKSLCSHIDSSKFISTHLNKQLLCSIDIDDHEGYVIHMSNLTNIQHCTVSSDRTFDRISELGIPFTFQCGIAQFLGSCNGILCLTDCVKYRKALVDDIFLWNPSIRIFKRLSAGTCLSQLNYFSLGFAYDSLNDDYKVVRITRPPTQPGPAPPPEFEVYTLSSDSWRRVEFGISWRPNILFYSFNCFMSFPFVSGHLHFMLQIRENMIDGGGGQQASAMILSFNVNSDKLGELPLPDDGSLKGGHYPTSSCLTSCKGKLALTESVHGLQSMVCSVWVMTDYGMRESWNKLYSVPLESPIRFIGFTMYGSLLFNKLSHLFFNNGKLEMANKFVLFDPKTLHQTDLSNQFLHPLNVIPLFVATYMESLALLDAADVVFY